MKSFSLSCYDDFQKLYPPGNHFSFRPIIVWAMNDKLDKIKLKQQLTSFKSLGYGGVMVMPWGGLPYDFMSDEWLDAVHYILKCATNLNLDIWIWDDWLFGSGTAGGRLTNNPAYRAKTLKTILDIVLEPNESANFIIPPRAISGAIFTVNKFGNPIGKSFKPVNITPEQQINIKANTRKRFIIVGWEYMSGMQHSTTSHAKFLDPEVSASQCDIYTCDDTNIWSVDMLNPKAINQYVKLIHQRYWDTMPELFGNTLKGFFYDEPKSASGLPWTENFVKRFKQIKGYDLTQYLPAMMVVYRQDGGDFTDKFRPQDITQAQSDYRDVWTTLLSETFYGTVQSWCKEHNVIATGHPIGDNSLYEIFSNGGCYFKNMDFSDMPGVDSVGGFNQIDPGEFLDFPRLAGSRASLLNKPRAMSESFAIYGHGTDLDQMRYVCEHQIIRGINTFFCKLSNYNRKKSFYFHPPELSEYNPIIKHFGQEFCERIRNISSLMNSGTIFSPRIALYVGMSNYYNVDLNIAKKTTAIAESLTYNQIEFDYIWDNDIIDMQITNGVIAGKFNHTYRYIILPDSIIIPSQIQKKIESLKKHNVICTLQSQDINNIINTCKAGTNHIMQSVSADIKISKKTRIMEEGIHCCMLLNESKKSGQLRIACTENTNILEVNLKTWQIEFITETSPDILLDLSFMPCESRILILDTTNKFKSTLKKSHHSSEELLLEGWTLETPDGKKNNLGSTLTDWEQLGFPDFTGFMHYSCEFAWSNASKKAMLSLGELCYAATVFLDDNKIGNCVFKPFNLLLKNLTKGRHLLEIHVLNTQANSVFGDTQTLEQLRSSRALEGTYAPLYEKLDKTKLRSGLLGPVKLHIIETDKPQKQQIFHKRILHD